MTRGPLPRGEETAADRERNLVRRAKNQTGAGLPQDQTLDIEKSRKETAKKRLACLNQKDDETLRKSLLKVVHLSSAEDYEKLKSAPRPEIVRLIKSYVRTQKEKEIREKTDAVKRAKTKVLTQNQRIVRLAMKSSEK